MKLFNKILTSAILIFGLLLSICTTPTFAQENNDYVLSAKKWSIDLGVIEPGNIVRDSITIVNRGTKYFSYKVYADPLTASEDGQNNYSEANAYTEIVDWISFDQEEGDLAPGEENTIGFSVSVPYDAPAGGQYASIKAEMTSLGDDTRESLTEDQDSRSTILAYGAIGVNLFSQVNGETRESGLITENNIPTFLFTTPVTTSALIENTGNIRSQASYYLQVFPFFSNEEIYTNEENPETVMVMPSAKRYVTQKWEDAPSLGLFKVKQTVTFANESSVVEKIVFICPVWLLVSIFALICFIFISLYIKSQKRKKSQKKSADKK